MYVKCVSKYTWKKSNLNISPVAISLNQISPISQFKQRITSQTELQRVYTIVPCSPLLKIKTNEPKRRECNLRNVTLNLRAIFQIRNLARQFQPFSSSSSFWGMCRNKETNWKNYTTLEEKFKNTYDTKWKRYGAKIGTILIFYSEW